MIDPDHARNLLREELAKAEYVPQRNWLQELRDWFFEHVLAPLFEHANSVPGALLTGLLVILAVAIGFSLRRFRMRHRVAAAPHDAPLSNTTTTAAEFRARAESAAAAGDFTLAYLEYFRAMARSGQERVLIPSDPGATAHELGRPLAAAFPAEEGEIAWAADGFDLFRYGEVLASADDVTRVRSVDQRLRAARPVVAV